jgi:putative ABC transport system permease protein
LTILLASIAGVSLLVGGIGIMNIMLVSVTERTREIGIRLAIGAKQSDILLQFLIEAVIICALGGLSGVILGISLSWVISYIVGITVEVTLVSIIISFLISSGIGVFFGWYPAKKASRMQPVDALRIE